MFKKNRTLSSQLTRWVSILSVIAIFGLLFAIAAILFNAAQSTQINLNEQVDLVANDFDQYLGGIEQDLRATSDALSLTPDRSGILRLFMERRPAILSLTLVSPQGQVLAQRRRLGGEPPTMVVDQPWLETVRAGELYIGQVDFQAFGVPLVILAVDVTDGSGEFIGTLVARLDLSALWDKVVRLRVGKTGYVYVTNEQGQLLAYRDLGLLKGVTLQDLTGKAPQPIVESSLSVYTGIVEEWVVGAGASLENVPWFVIVEQPLDEALGVFFLPAVIVLLALLIVGGLVYRILRFARRQIAAPLRLMREGVDVLSQGRLDHRIDIEGQGEFGALATAFNAMATRLRETISSLEQRVAERTADLEATTADLAARRAEAELATQRQAEVNRQLEDTVLQSQRRAVLLQAGSEVSRAVAQVRDLDALLPQITQLISQNFGYYHAGIFLVDEAGRYAVLRAANSKGGQRMLARHHRLLVGLEGVVGYVVETGQPRVALDVGEDLTYFDNPDLPQTRSELALPLRVGDRMLGALDVQSRQSEAFTEEDVDVLTVLAGQIAIAIDNANLFHQTQEALEEARATQQRYMQEQWARYVGERPQRAYEYTLMGVPASGEASSVEAQEAWSRGELVHIVRDDADPGEAQLRAVLAAPIKVRGEIIGVLDLQETDQARQWTQDEVELIQSVADQLGQALESARLFEETQRRARYETLTRQITDRIRSRAEVDAMLQTAIQELARSLGAPRVFVRLAPEALTGEGQSELNGGGREESAHA